MSPNSFNFALIFLKTILEKQFDQNSSFKEKVNKLAPEDMRFQPIGRDKNGLAYWYMLVCILILCYTYRINNFS